MKYFDISKQPNIMVTRGHVFTNPQQEREYTWPWTPRPADIVFVDHAGWHFTYFGDDTNIVTKLKNFAHTESDVPRFTSGELKIEWMIENKYGLWGPDHHERYDIVVVDDYFPKYITENIGERKQEAKEVLRGCIAEIVDYRKEHKTEDSNAEKVRQLLTSITPEDFSSVSKETARNII